MQDLLIAIDYRDPLWILIAFVLGLGARLMNLPPLVGFLLAGFLLNWGGAEGGAFLDELADLGVTLLLFTIGLKLRVDSLLRPRVWGVATIHLALNTLLFGAGLLLLGGTGLPLVAGLDLASAMLIGFALSFSSTVFAVKVLEDSGEIGAQHAQVAVGVLIMQDIVAVVFLAASAGKLPSPWAFALLGLVPLRPLLQHVMVRAGHGELLILFGIVMALGGAALFEVVGMKGDLGALVFGVLLGSHAKAGELAKALFGFKELFLVGFFLSIGMAGLPGSGEILLALLLLLVLPLKVMLYLGLFTRFHMRARPAVLASLSLANYSEFGLIVGAIAVSAGWLAPAWLVAIAIALSLSYVVAAPLNEAHETVYDRFHGWFKRLETAKSAQRRPPLHLDNVAVLVLGMGRVGTGAYDALRAGYADGVVGVDFNARTVARHAEAGRRVIIGDPLSHEFWESVGLCLARQPLILLTLPNHLENLAVVKILRELDYAGGIASVARYPDEVEELRGAGVQAAYNIYSEAGLGFATHVQQELDIAGERSA